MYKILVVDDDPYILMSLEFFNEKKRLRSNGLPRNGNEALEILNLSIPDIVLLDIMMPDVNGYDICKYIKSTKSLRGIKVIFMSAKTRDTDIKKGYDLGAALYIKKPFSTRELVKDIKGLLES